MKKLRLHGARWLTGFCLLLLAGCEKAQNPMAADESVATAEAMLDAFYSFDAAALAQRLAGVAEADTVLYYQAWAKAANYRIQTRRPCTTEDDSTLICAVTVTDDFGQTLGYVATDTFTLSFENHQLVSVLFEGDDPPVFSELFVWIGANQPAVITGPCKDMFQGGETPAGCARAVVTAARQFVAVASEQ